jgi:ADP-heptose:LPS heptosyltransferase
MAPCIRRNISRPRCFTSAFRRRRSARISLCEASAASRPYAVIHPIAATPAKNVDRRRVPSVAEHLRRDHDLDPVFIAGPGEDLSMFAADYRTVVGAPLAETKSLLRGASLFVGNDSGPAHMAAAFGLPVVVLFGPSDSVVWALAYCLASSRRARGH